MNDQSRIASGKLPYCRDLDESTLERLVRFGTRVWFAKDEVAFHKGDSSDALFLVLTGSLEAREPPIGPRGSEPGTGTALIRKGELTGLLGVLSGEPRSLTVVAVEDAELLRFSAADVNGLIREEPSSAAALSGVAQRRLRRRELARRLPDLFGQLTPEALADIGSAFRWLRIARGERLFAQGDRGDTLYLLVSGRLQVQVDSGLGQDKVVGEIVPGETVGEMALLTGETRSATVVALRDSVLEACDRPDFERLTTRYPGLLRHLSRFLVERLKHANVGSVRRPARMTLALVPLHAGTDLGDFARRLVRALAESHRVLHLKRDALGGEVTRLLAEEESGLQQMRLLPWFEEHESRHDLVVYEAEDEVTPWTSRSVRQADRIVLVANADRDSHPGEMEAWLGRTLGEATAQQHLVLLHPPDAERPSGTRAWLDPRTLNRHYHVRAGNDADVARAARLLIGRGRGLVLGGGGARGFAHIGVIRALGELGIAIDAVGGTSAGAGIAAEYALGKTTSEMRDAGWNEVVVQRPLSKYTLPVYALVSRTGLDRAARSAYGDADVADTWIPFYCTSSDIQNGEKVVHRRGPLWKAVRASTSVPGIAPPVIDGSRLLVDGAILDNVPEQDMISFCGGEVIAVDVSPGEPIPIDYDYDELPTPWQVVRSRLNPFRRVRMRIPSLLEVLVRTATVSDKGQRAQLDRTVDLVLRPPVHSFGLLEFTACDRIIEVSYAYSRQRLEEWWAERQKAGT